MSKYVIIGNGAAGVSAAEVIRRRDPQGDVTILTEEKVRMYSRPGLAYLINGQVSEEQVITRTESFYEQHRLKLRYGPATHLDLQRRLVYLVSGESLPYDVVLMATGAGAVRPPFVGGDLDGVITFDNIADAREVISRGRRAKSAVVVGGGITAMELAEGLAHQRAKTHLLQRRNRIWEKLFDPQESAIIEEQMHHHGIKVHYDEEIEEILGKGGKVAGVRLTSGAELPCQIVGVAIGVRPNMGLVKALSLEQDRGILVNNHMQSSVPELFAAGDVAQVYDRWTQQHHLDVLWPSAINEGRAAGYNMVDVARGKNPAYTYEKGSPFNAALLFGVHLTVIGQISGDRGENGDEGGAFFMSRGSSQVWTSPFRTGVRSAWDHEGPNSIRLATAEGRIIGALLMGNQELADPLRYLVNNEVDISKREEQILRADADLPALVMQLYAEAR